MTSAPKGIWFTQGYSNLYHAMANIRQNDPLNEFSLICSHPHPEFVGLMAADVRLHEPSSMQGGLKFVESVIEAHNVKVIVPSRDQSWFNKHKPYLESKGVQVLTVADSKTLKLVDNKVSLYTYLAKKKLVNLPQFRSFKSLRSFDKAYDELQANGSQVLCIKPARGVYGSGFRILKTNQSTMCELLAESPAMAVDDLRNRLSLNGSNQMLLMQYLSGSEYSVDCLAKNGQLIVGVVRRKSASSLAAQIIQDRPDLIAQVAALTKELNLNGLFNVQFKDLNGVPYLLEINTRLSGRSYYATMAGVNLPWLAANVFGNGADPATLPITPKFGMRIANVNGPVVLSKTIAVNDFDFFESR